MSSVGELKMSSKTCTFWHWYFVKRYRHPFVSAIGTAACVVLVVACGIFLLDRSQKQFYAFSLTDPFFLSAFVIFISSQVTLDYMRYRLSGEDSVPESRSVFSIKDSIKDLKVPEQYKDLFGNDFVYMLWKFRLIFLVLFFVGAVRWLLEIGGLRSYHP
jgi:uncharacterized membrane protein